MNVKLLTEPLFKVDSYMHFKESDKDSTSEDLMLFQTRSAFSASLLPRCRESFSNFSSVIDCALKVTTQHPYGHE